MLFSGLLEKICFNQIQPYYFFIGKSLIRSGRGKNKKERFTPFLYLLKILYISPLFPAKIVLIIIILPSTISKSIL